MTRSPQHQHSPKIEGIARKLEIVVAELASLSNAARSERH